MEDQDDEQKYEQGFNEQQFSSKNLIGESDHWNRNFARILMENYQNESDAIISLFQKIPNVGEKDIHMIISAMKCVIIQRNEIDKDKFEKQTKFLMRDIFPSHSENDIKIALCRYCRYLIFHKDTLYYGD